MTKYLLEISLLGLLLATPVLAYGPDPGFLVPIIVIPIGVFIFLVVCCCIMCRICCVKRQPVHMQTTIHSPPPVVVQQVMHPPYGYPPQEQQYMYQQRPVDNVPMHLRPHPDPQQYNQPLPGEIHQPPAYNVLHSTAHDNLAYDFNMHEPSAPPPAYSPPRQTQYLGNNFPQGAEPERKF